METSRSKPQGEIKHQPSPTEVSQIPYSCGWERVQGQRLYWELHGPANARASVHGHSDGGTIAPTIAAQYPLLVKRLATAAAHTYFEPKIIDSLELIAQTVPEPPLKKLKRKLAASNLIWLLGIALGDRTTASTFEPDWRLVVQYHQDPAASTPAVVSLTSHPETEGYIDHLARSIRLERRHV